MRTAFNNDGYWQAIRSLGFNIPDRYLEARVQTSSLPVSLLLPETPMPTSRHKGQ
jgi:hypothetical protein